MIKEIILGSSLLLTGCTQELSCSTPSVIKTLMSQLPPGVHSPLENIRVVQRDDSLPAIVCQAEVRIQERDGTWSDPLQVVYSVQQIENSDSLYISLLSLKIVWRPKNG